MKQRSCILAFLLCAAFLLFPALSQALSESDFVPLATGGFGDSANSYSWGLTEFNGDIYVSTGRHHLSSMMSAIPMMGVGLPDLELAEPPPGSWGEEEWADAHRAEIWRLRNGSWKRVYQSGTYFIPEEEAIVSPLLPDTPLWGYFPNAYAYRTLGTFGGHIYALGVGTWMPPIANTTVLRSADGDNWEDVTGNLADTTNIRAFATWRDHVYVAASVRGEGQTGAGGCLVFRNNNDPNGETWEPICEVGFGDLLNEEIYFITVFNDCLYASTVNYANGFEVWKTDGTVGADGKFVWKQVIKDGFGDTWCQYGMHMEPFGDYLYVGSAVGAGMVMKDGQPVGSRAFDIIRLDKDDNAELMVGAYSPSDPPAGWPTFRVPTSLLPAGFGNPLNGYAWHMGVYKDTLLVGTADMSGVILHMIKTLILSDPAAATEMVQNLQASSTSIPAEQFELLNDLDLFDADQVAIATRVLDYLMENFGGADLWKTRDGIHWAPVTLSGFGNWHNYGFRRVVPIAGKGGKKESLFIGTANPFTGVEGGGCEVWADVDEPPYNKQYKIKQ